MGKSLRRCCPAHLRHLKVIMTGQGRSLYPVVRGTMCTLILREQSGQRGRGYVQRLRQTIAV